MPQTVECPSTTSGAATGEGGLTLCWCPQGACITLLHEPEQSYRAAQSLTSAWKKCWNPAFETTSGGKKEAGTELQKSFRSRWKTNNLTMHSKHCSINTHHWVQYLHSHPHSLKRLLWVKYTHKCMYTFIATYRKKVILHWTVIHIICFEVK